MGTRIKKTIEIEKVLPPYVEKVMTALGQCIPFRIGIEETISILALDDINVSLKSRPPDGSDQVSYDIRITMDVVILDESAKIDAALHRALMGSP